MAEHVHEQGQAHGHGHEHGHGHGHGVVPAPLRLVARFAHWGQTRMFGLADHAEAYDRVAGRFARPLYRRVVNDVLARGLPAGSVVLDVGTGPGRLPHDLATRRPDLHVEGVDLSEPMIDHALRQVGPQTPNLTYRVADAAALPHDDASVDLVVSSLSLHHWGDAAAGLADVRRVLRPGGEAWIYDVPGVLRSVVAENAAQNATQDAAESSRGPGLRLEPLGGLLGRLVSRLVVSPLP